MYVTFRAIYIELTFGPNYVRRAFAPTVGLSFIEWKQL